MEQKTCGVCMFEIGSRKTNGGYTVYCVYNLEWKESNGTCDKWIKSSSRMSKEDRINLATAKRETETRLKQHKEILKSENKNRKLLVTIAIFSFLFGVLTIVIAQWIINLWK